MKSASPQRYFSPFRNGKFVFHFILFTLVFLCTTHQALAQINFAWAVIGTTSALNTQPMEATKTAADVNGNVYTAGYYKGTVDFDPSVGIYNLTSNGDQEIFIQKLDANGNLLWVKTIGGIGSDAALSMEMDAAGNIYTTGYFMHSVDFNPGVGVNILTGPSNGGTNAFILKLNVNGIFVWAKGFGEIESILGYDLAIDLLGNVYSTGYFSGTVDFNPGTGINNLLSNGATDIFIQKLDINGNYVWAKNFGDSQIDIGYAITTDDQGNIYTTGNFAGIVDFDPGIGIYSLATIGSQPDIFIQKMNASGSFIWAKSIGGTPVAEYCFDITVDASGNVYTTGDFQTTIDFDPGPSVFNLVANGSVDIFIQKLDINGNFVWAKGMGAANDDIGYAVEVDATGNVYTTGYFKNTIDFDPGSGTNSITSFGQSDIFVQKLDASGNFIWAMHMGGSSFDEGNGVAINSNGNIYIAGFYSGTADLDPTNGVYNVSGNNLGIFTLKLFHTPPCNTTYSIVSDSICFGGSYNFNGTNLNTAGAYVDTLVNAAGCDSILTLNLTVLPTPTFTSISDTTLCLGESISATLNNSTSANVYLNNNLLTTLMANSVTGEITYTTFQSGSYTLSSSNGNCTVILDFIVYPLVNNTITQIACDSYTWSANGLTYTASGVYTETNLNANGCLYTQVLNLTINSTPNVTISATPTNICAGASTNLTASGTTSYSWMPGSLSGPSITVSPTVTTTYTVTGTNASGCTKTLTHTITVNTCGDATINMTAFIQGYYFGNELMKPVLLNQGVGNSTTVCDTFTIELHYAFSPYALAYSYTGDLNTNGTITTVWPSATFGNSYYLAVYTRNGLETWSANPVQIGTDTIYNFSTSASQAYGSNQFEVEPGIWAIYSGDINQDQTIDALDYILLDPDLINGESGYLSTDLNGDGTVDALDYILLDPNLINGIGSITP